MSDIEKFKERFDKFFLAAMQGILANQNRVETKAMIAIQAIDQAKEAMNQIESFRIAQKAVGEIQNGS